MAALPAQGGHRRFGEPPRLRAHAEGLEPGGVVEQFGAVVAGQREYCRRSGDQPGRVDVAYGDGEPLHDAGRRLLGREPGRVRQVLHLDRPATGVPGRIGGGPHRRRRGHEVTPGRRHGGVCPGHLARDDGDRVGPAAGQDAFGGVGLSFLGQADSQPAGRLRAEEAPTAGLLPHRLPQQRDRLRPTAEDPLEIAAEQRRLGALLLSRYVRAAVAVVRGRRVWRVGRVSRAVCAICAVCAFRGPQQPDVPYDSREFGQVRRAGPVCRCFLGERDSLLRTSGQREADGEGQAGGRDARPARRTAQDPLGGTHGRARAAAEEQHQRVCAVQGGQFGGHGHLGAQRVEFHGGACRIAVGPAAVLGERDGLRQPCVRFGRLGSGPFQDPPRLGFVAELHQCAGQRDGGGAGLVQGPAREAAGEVGVVPVGRLGRPDQETGVDGAVGVQLPAGPCHLIRFRQCARGEQGAREPAAAQQGQPLACRRAQHRPAQPHQDLAVVFGRADVAPGLQALDDVGGHRLQDGQRERFAQGDGVQGVPLHRPEAAQLTVEQLGKARRHGHRAAPPPQAARLPQAARHPGVPDQFGHEQRVSAGPPEQEVHGGPRRLAVDQRARQPCGVGGAERRQVDAFQVLVLPQRHHGVRHLQAGAGGDDQTQASLGGQVQRQDRGPLVEPVHVVDDEHRGALSGTAAQFAADQAVRPAVVERRVDAEQSPEHAEGNAPARLGGRRPDDFEARGVEPARHGGEQRRLSDTGGPDHRHAPLGHNGAQHLLLFLILGDQRSGTQIVRHCFSPVRLPRPPSAARRIGGAVTGAPTAPRHRGPDAWSSQS
ncbi:hypothetical protein STRAU_2295 [Streptomyces aurantiacus JA 4570]|uniref:Uncharacterized protein n=1 Tax=Streptomyces aurantiacus JA 4570 TaxID=1286094 RepID=S4ATI8_9ACTN|nr:hypothetical protein STRAU_2295 [Streptomyces aurantiacus JA 4570]